ncbi:MAG: hypothetical protein LBT62_00850, partial [Deltaproteobacteria bacterium]|nr:hypothetical protein [Deltaproteobacteria bacterium]
MTTYTRPADDLRVGGDIDAQCGKCRQTTNHRIVSMVDGVVKHVICLTCNSKHNYRVPVVVAPKKTGPAAKVKAATKAARASRESAAQKETMESKAIKEPKAAKSAASKAPKA